MPDKILFTEEAGQQPSSLPDIGDDARQRQTPQERLKTLWPLIESDANELRSIANFLTPTSRLLALWEGNTLSAPAIHAGTTIQRVMSSLPEQPEHLVLVPWLGVAGGSEKVTQRLLKLLAQLYVPGKVAVLAPDQIFDLPPAARLSYDLPIAVLNDVTRSLSYADRADIVDRIIRQVRPTTLHIINAEAGWDALRERASDYERLTNVFVNIYSDVRLRDGAPAGYFWRHLPSVVEHVAGVFADNAAVVARAAENFSLLPGQLLRFHIVPTPILGLDGTDPLSECRAFTPAPDRHTLWMSRIAPEKRIDVVRDIATMLPYRHFSIYGAILPGAAAGGLLDWTQDSPNARYEGYFTSFDTLPLDEFESYLFTTSAEGMPLSLLEAAMLGLPTVAPAIGGIGEMIDNTTGWLIAREDDVEGYASALEEISSHPGEAALRVARAQARLIEKHSWDSFIKIVSAIPDYLVHGALR